MLNKTKIQISSIALALSLSPAVLGGELITNGSFENFTVSKDNGRWKLVQFDHWQGAGEVWTSALGKAATDGAHKIELDVGKELNTLSQTVTTVADQKYRFSLDAYARRANSSDFEILVDATVIATIKPDSNWAEHEAYFVGTGGEQTISIKELDTQSNGLGTIIDNVSLTESNELIVNGSFEDFTVNKDNGRWKLVDFTGWEGAGEVWTNRLGKRSTLGVHKIELDVGRELNTLSQTMTTENGAEYELSLDAYARTINSSDFELWLDDEKLLAVTPTSDWDRYSVKFFGNGTTQRISIKEVATQNSGLGTVIDNVSLMTTGEQLNATPTIAGTSITKINTGDSYTFTPTASDENIDDTLTFSITNQPNWASFDTATGELSGTPTSESISNDIVISVSDGTETVSLAPFSIKVSTTVNLAHKFGKATQGDIWAKGYANKAIDNNPKTYNHANDVPPNNWWQLELPKGTKISKIVIHNSTYRPYRLKNAKMYLNKKSHIEGSSDMGNLNQTLSADGVQTFTYDTPVDARYVLMQGNLDPKKSLSLHMGEVEVYGTISPEPSFTDHESNYQIQSNTGVGSTIASLSALDYQGDELSYRIIGDMPFSIDNDGNITVSKALTASHYNIVAEVSDGTHSSQTTLSIDVGVNLAHKYGKATQGDIWAKGYANKAIDNNPKTYNHANDVPPNNWWQLELPEGTKISKIVIHNSTYRPYRLKNAKMYLNKKSHVEGSSDMGSLNQTLSADGVQTFTYDTPVDAKYVLMQGNLDPKNSLSLHMGEVEVYGTMHPVPRFTDHEKNYQIQGSTSVGSTIASLSASDYQGDKLNYRIIGDTPFSIDNDGNISVSKTLTASQYNIVVEVSDGTHSSQTTLTVKVTSSSAVSDAIQSGDVTNVTAQELVQATLDEIEASKDFLLTAKAKIFNLNADGSVKDDGSSLTLIDWNPTHDASTFISTLGKNTPLLTTNAVSKVGKNISNKELAIIGEKANARYMVMGANPLRVTGNEQMNQVMENAIAWLSGRDNLKEAPFNVVMAQIDESYWFRDESKTRAWLDTHYAGQINYNSADSCDASALSGCLKSDTDLLIISQLSQESDDVEAIAASVNQALQQGISVLYIHHDGNQKTLGKTLFSDVFDVRYEWDNYWKKLSLRAYNPIENINILPANLAKIKTLFTHFKDLDYSFNWSQCIKENCNTVTGLSAEFQQGASVVKGMMNSLDANKKNIFTEDGYRVQKLLALTADKFRQGVSFPMDKVSTDSTRFLKSYYADHAVYNYRDINPAQANMGNFSRSNFSHITPTSRTVNYTTKNGFHSTGAYALPGQTVSVTRNDNSAVSVKVFVNTQRSGSTHQWASNGYKRPKYLKSQSMEIKSGETISFTSPYGGPIQLAFGGKDLPVSVSLNNIGEHPYWASAADDASFTQKMDEGNYDWAEISTTGFEVHSTLEKMRESIANPQWGSAQALATATMRYMYNLPHALAGFQGPNIDPIPELHDFANQNGWTINTLDKIQHMNADQASCGYGCSGNPYDAYWAFNPTGHGDVHELGHGLQGGKRFAGWENHSMTNYYSYFTKAQYHKDTGGDPSCQSLPFESNFKVLQDSVNQADPATYVKANIWDNNSWSKSAGMFIQMMMAAQNEGALQDGWLLRGRLHMFERELNRAKKTEVLWNQKRDSLGLGEYSWADIKSINNNDWYLVATTYVTGRDFSDYFDMWAIPYSIKAKAQVTALSYDMMPKQYYKSGAKDYCLTLDKTAIAVDGQQAW